MALIIRGKLPVGKGCDECEFQTSRCEQLDACTCFLFNGCINNFHNERHKDCPIIGEIPDKHGDLKDETDIIHRIDRFAEDSKSGFVEDVAQDIITEVIASPTIVEATE